MWPLGALSASLRFHRAVLRVNRGFAKTYTPIFQGNGATRWEPEKLWSSVSITVYTAQL